MAAPFRVDVGPSGLSLDIRIAIPPSAERSWPAHKFQDFLGEAATTSELPLGKTLKVVNFLGRKLSTTNAKDEKSRGEVETKSRTKS